MAYVYDRLEQLVQTLLLLSGAQWRELALLLDVVHSQSVVGHHLHFYFLLLGLLFHLLLVQEDHDQDLVLSSAGGDSDLDLRRVNEHLDELVNSLDLALIAARLEQLAQLSSHDDLRVLLQSFGVLPGVEQYSSSMALVKATLSGLRAWLFKALYLAPCLSEQQVHAVRAVSLCRIVQAGVLERVSDLREGSLRHEHLSLLAVHLPHELSIQPHHFALLLPALRGQDGVIDRQRGVLLRGLDEQAQGLRIALQARPVQRRAIEVGVEHAHRIRAHGDQSGNELRAAAVVRAPVQQRGQVEAVEQQRAQVVVVRPLSSVARLHHLQAVPDEEMHKLLVAFLARQVHRVEAPLRLLPAVDSWTELLQEVGNAVLVAVVAASVHH